MYDSQRRIITLIIVQEIIIQEKVPEQNTEKQKIGENMGILNKN